LDKLGKLAVNEPDIWKFATFAKFVTRIAHHSSLRQTAPHMSTLKYGIFDWVDVNGEMPVNLLFEQRLRMLEYADEAGFFCYHVAEHHGTPLSMSPSPNLLLTAVAQRTTRLRVGSMVSILPLMNPVRMVEEA